MPNGDHEAYRDIEAQTALRTAKEALALIGQLQETVKLMTEAIALMDGRLEEYTTDVAAGQAKRDKALDDYKMEMGKTLFNVGAITGDLLRRVEALEE